MWATRLSSAAPRRVRSIRRVWSSRHISRRMPRVRLCCARGYLGRELDHESLDASLMGCPTPGRFDVLGTDPLKLIDACHNPPELRELCERVGRDRSVRGESPHAAVRCAGRQGRGRHRRRADSRLSTRSRDPDRFRPRPCRRRSSLPSLMPISSQACTPAFPRPLQLSRPQASPS